MNLIINQTFARLSAHTTPSRLMIESRNARLELSHKEAKVDVHTELPRVEIDQYECFATSGLMGPIDLSRDAARRGMAQAIEYAGQVSQDGNRIAAIENPDPIPDIVQAHAFPEKEFGIDYMPKARPKITVKGGVQIKSQGNGDGINNGVQGVYTPGGVGISYTPAKVNISMDRYPSIKMRVERPGFSKYI